MKRFSVLVMVMASVSAQYPDPRPQYGVAPAPQYGSPPQENEVFMTALPKDVPVDLKVFRHVFVHSVPDDSQVSNIRRIRGPGGDEKHVNIIFVKAPAPAAPDQQVVDVPNDGGRKTLVYVLLKKAAESPDVKFSGPPPTKASKPEVYFIRYKDPAKQTTTTATPPGIYGVPAQQESVYGPPSQQGYKK